MPAVLRQILADPTGAPVPHRPAEAEALVAALFFRVRTDTSRMDAYVTYATRLPEAALALARLLVFNVNQAATPEVIRAATRRSWPSVASAQLDRVPSLMETYRAAAAVDPIIAEGLRALRQPEHIPAWLDSAPWNPEDVLVRRGLVGLLAPEVLRQADAASPHAVAGVALTTPARVRDARNAGHHTAALLAVLEQLATAVREPRLELLDDWRNLLEFPADGTTQYDSPDVRDALARFRDPTQWHPVAARHLDACGAWVQSYLQASDLDGLLRDAAHAPGGLLDGDTAALVLARSHIRQALRPHGKAVVRALLATEPSAVTALGLAILVTLRPATMDHAPTLLDWVARVVGARPTLPPVFAEWVLSCRQASSAGRLAAARHLSASGTLTTAHWAIAARDFSLTELAALVAAHPQRETLLWHPEIPGPVRQAVILTLGNMSAPAPATETPGGDAEAPTPQRPRA